MEPTNDSLLWRFKWHIVIICAALLIVFLLVVSTNIFQEPETGALRQLVWLLEALICVSAMLTMLSRLFKMLDALKDNSASLSRLPALWRRFTQG